MPYNLASPNGLAEPCDIADLDGWLQRELQLVPSAAERAVISDVTAHLNSFVEWASEALLLWPGCDRIAKDGRRGAYFSGPPDKGGYPDHIKVMAEGKGLRLDTRANGPAIASFVLAGGRRPKRYGSSNDWSIHHLYSGKFPYLGHSSTTHAGAGGPPLHAERGLDRCSSRGRCALR